MKDILRLFQPETVFRWHRGFVKKKRTYKQTKKGGRPPIPEDLEALIIRLTKENPRWGYGKLEGELLKLGYVTSVTTIANVLRRNSIQPAPVRGGSVGWKQLLTHYKDQLLACYFFTVETISLQTLYVLFFIEIGSRRTHLAGISAHPNAGWVTQQARQIPVPPAETETHGPIQRRKVLGGIIHDYYRGTEAVSFLPAALS